MHHLVALFILVALPTTNAILNYAVIPQCTYNNTQPFLPVAYQGHGSHALGATSIQVQSDRLLSDHPVIMIIQIQRGTLGEFGNVEDYARPNSTVNNAGNYEFNVIQSVESFADNTTRFDLAWPLSSSFEQSSFLVPDTDVRYSFTFQVVHVPFCDVVSFTGSHTIPGWDGRFGGVAAVIANKLSMVDTVIDASGAGYRGGPDSGLPQITPPARNNQPDYAIQTNVTDYAWARKGEGFIGSPAGYDYPAITSYPELRDGARGASGNAGGGGNAWDGGGGGGSHAGRGGNGGKTENHSSRVNTPGFGAYSISPAVDTLFMGGGGGAGNRNSGTDRLGAVRGMDGGGIVYIHVNSIISLVNSAISATGGTPEPEQRVFDGSGGGGAGGTILLASNDIVPGSNWEGLSSNANGGDGAHLQKDHPGGGGGGGGVVMTTASNLSAYSVSGGANRDTARPETVQATPGEDGLLLPRLQATELSSYRIFTRYSSSRSHSPTPSVTPTATASTSFTATASATPSSSRSPTRSRTPSHTASNSRTPSLSLTPTPTSSSSSSRTVSNSPSPSFVPSRTASASLSVSLSVSRSVSASEPARILLAPEPTPSPTPSYVGVRSGQGQTPSPRAVAMTVAPGSPPPNFNPTEGSSIQSLNKCASCESGSLQLPIQQQQTNSQNGPQRVNLETSTGRAGELRVPSNVGGRDLDVNLEVNFIVGPGGDTPRKPGTVGGTIVEIILQDSAGDPIRQLQHPLTICMDPASSLPGAPKDDVCLSYYDEEKEEWICQDECLSEEEGLLCGETPHLTNFALLLNPNNGNKCGQEAVDEVVVWLTTSFTIAAILGVLMALLLIELNVRVKQARHARLLSEIGRQSSSYHGEQCV